jgi:hypothetical protein
MLGSMPSISQHMPVVTNATRWCRRPASVKQFGRMGVIDLVVAWPMVIPMPPFAEPDAGAASSSQDLMVKPPPLRVHGWTSP